MSAGREQNGLLRIGDVARLVGTTPRTIRYYEEIGLLPEAAGRDRGRHRAYDEGGVERLRELLRLRDLLGISLEELKQLVEAEEALGHIDRQLELVKGRRVQLKRLEDELAGKRRRLRDRLRRLETGEAEPQ